jgi:hypothetical protein
VPRGREQDKLYRWEISPAQMQMITERISQGAAPAVLKDEPRFNLHDRFMYGNEQSCEPLRVIAG